MWREVSDGAGQAVGVVALQGEQAIADSKALAELHEHCAAAAELRAMSDKQLATPIPVRRSPDPTPIGQVAERMLIGHLKGHATSVEAAVGAAQTSPAS